MRLLYPGLSCMVLLKNQEVNLLFNKGCRKFASQDVKDSLWSISKRRPLFVKKRKFP